MKLSALGCLRRGFASLRANWGLVWVQWLEAALLWVLGMAGAALLLAGLGFDLATTYALLIEGEPPAWGGELERGLAEFSPALLGGLVGAVALWTLALFVYCWFAAGTYGVLIAADRQAAAGARDRRLFRTFSARDFAGWAGRYLWRYFALLNLFALLATPLLVLTMLWLLLLGFGTERWGYGAALGIGCGGALPLAFLALVLAVGMWLAMADAAREGSGVWTATGNGLRVLGRRLGAATFLTVVIAFLGMVQVAVVLVLTFGIERGTAGGTLARAGAILALSAGQWLVAGVLGVLVGAAAVALVQAEVRAAPAAPPRSAAA
jgi:hypothetical protein